MRRTSLAKEKTIRHSSRQLDTRTITLQHPFRSKITTIPPACDIAHSYRGRPPGSGIIQEPSPLQLVIRIRTACGLVSSDASLLPMPCRPCLPPPAHSACRRRPPTASPPPLSPPLAGIGGLHLLLGRCAHRYAERRRGRGGEGVR